MPAGKWKRLLWNSHRRGGDLLKTMIRKSGNPDKRMRWQIVYTVAADPRDPTTIALQPGCCKCLVSNAVREYNRLASSRILAVSAKGKTAATFIFLTKRK